MSESVRLFEAILNNNFFYATPIILFLNKTDLFREKLPYAPLTAAFPHYEGTTPAPGHLHPCNGPTPLLGGGSDFEEASDFIKDEFKLVNRNSEREVPLPLLSPKSTEPPPLPDLRSQNVRNGHAEYPIRVRRRLRCHHRPQLVQIWARPVTPVISRERQRRSGPGRPGHIELVVLVGGQ